MYSYYSPVIPTTVNTSYGVSGNPTYVGEPVNLVVTSDLGRRTYGFTNGSLAWTRDFPTSWPRGVDMCEGLVFYAEGNRLFGVNPKNDFNHVQLTVSDNIISFRFTKAGSKIFLTVCYSRAGAGSIEVFEYKNGQITPHWVNPIPASNSRNAYVRDNKLYVADTFGHQVYVVDMYTGAKITWTNVYYPNMIDAISNEVVMICAEHENRVFNWNYVTGSRTMVYSAPVALYSNMANGSAFIMANEASTGAPTPPAPPMSLCSVAYSGEETLYSPNSARMFDDLLVIADTDNHRVIGIRAGSIVFTITGFNNPVGAVIF